mmetsp:Transcript_24098/g.39870  ORF Transcript_24098/g.39870 Transcript_24098/m.39870 type:complete len:209 (-) Transcript_24098:475-1101(-)
MPLPTLRDATTTLTIGDPSTHPVLQSVLLPFALTVGALDSFSIALIFTKCSSLILEGRGSSTMAPPCLLPFPLLLLGREDVTNLTTSTWISASASDTSPRPRLLPGTLSVPSVSSRSCWLSLWQSLFPFPSFSLAPERRDAVVNLTLVSSFAISHEERERNAERRAPRISRKACCPKRRAVAPNPTAPDLARAARVTADLVRRPVAEI